MSDPDQRAAALALANDVRLARATAKRRLAAGDVTLATLLGEGDERLLGMKLRELLMALPRFGPTKVNALMASFHLRATITVERVSAPTRVRLLAELERGDERARRERAQRAARVARARMRERRAERSAA